MDYKSISRINVSKVGAEWLFTFYDRSGNKSQTVYKSDIYHYIKYLYDFFALDQKQIEYIGGVYSIIVFLRYEYQIEITETK